MIHFDLPKEQSSIIKVIGVGGGGSNAVNHMYDQNIDGVNFIICNTDSQAIAQSKVPNKIQLGPHLTQGLGAGANPEIGRQAMEESLEEIKRILEVNTKMAFITAGMGGGTGTGGAPILAKICKDLGILTVGIITTPFAYEGKKRLAQADEGIAKLKENVDTLLIISNDKLRHQYGNLKMKEAFCKADNVLATAAKCITDVINTTGQINVDFADVCTVMKGGGVAILGSATAGGENRAQVAIENALNSPLLNDSDIRGAKWILININSAEGEHEFTMDEVDIIQNHLLGVAGDSSDVILGIGYDNTLGNEIGITIIATGFERNDLDSASAGKSNEVNSDKIIMQLEMPEKNNEKIVMPVAQSLPEVEKELVAELEPTPAIELAPMNEIVFAAEEEIQEKIVLHFDDAADDFKMESSQMNEVVVEKNVLVNAIDHIEISTTADQTPVVLFDIPEVLAVDQNLKQAEEPNEELAKTEFILEADESNKNASASMSSIGAGHLVKPKNLYVEESVSDVPTSTTMENPTPLQSIPQADEPVFEMHLVVKNIHDAAEDQTTEDQTLPNFIASEEEPALQDESEELRRRATERISKLRNLSFNINAADPNNEFETVPAYLRRNMELHNSIANVESFYSNYSVTSDDQNNVEISSINKFLDGKKPD